MFWPMNSSLQVQVFLFLGVTLIVDFIPSKMWFAAVSEEG